MDGAVGSGTVYGGSANHEMEHVTTAFPIGNAVENSGSLTGHILAQGRCVVLLVSLSILVAVGLSVALLAGDAFSSVFDGLLGG